MQTITFQIPDGCSAYVLAIPNGQGARVVTAFAGTYGFTGQEDDPQNTGHKLTPNTFAEEKIIDLVYGVVEAFEGKQAAASARQTVSANVRSSVQIVRGVPAA